MKYTYVDTSLQALLRERKLPFDFQEVAQRSATLKKCILKQGGFFTKLQVASKLPYQAADMFAEAHDQGLGGQELEYRYPGDEEGDQRLHQYRPAIELHLEWYHLAGRIIAKAKADKSRHGHPTKSMRRLLGTINKEAWKTTLLALHEAKRRRNDALDDCGM